MDEAKNQISNLKYMEAKNTQSEQQEKRIQKNEDSVRSLWDNFKCTNIHIMGVLEGEKREQKIENLFEKMTENFPELVKEIVSQVQEVQRVPNKMNLKRPRRTIIKMPKVKEMGGWAWESEREVRGVRSTNG